MQKVIGVKLNNLAKVYFFDPKNLDLKIGDKVIVSTAVGMALGTITFGEREIDETELSEPIKEIVRIASEKDLEIQKQNQEKARKALVVIKENVKSLNLQMKIVSAEYTFDGSKIVIDFTAEERVDFRELL